MRTQKVNFNYTIYDKEDNEIEVEVTATVYKGSTPAMGDDPDNVDIESIFAFDEVKKKFIDVTDEISDYYYGCIYEEAFERVY